MRSRSWAVRRFIDASLSSEAACVKRPMRIMNIGIRGMTRRAMSADQKNAISHRGIAFRTLMPHIVKYLRG